MQIPMASGLFLKQDIVSFTSPTGDCLQVTVFAGTIPKMAAKKPATFLRLMAHHTCARQSQVNAKSGAQC